MENKYLKMSVGLISALLPLMYAWALTPEEQMVGPGEDLSSVILFFKIVFYSIFLILPLGIFLLVSVFLNARKKKKLKKAQFVFGICFTVLGAFIYSKINPFQLDTKMASKQPKREVPPSYEQVLKKLNSDEFESLGFMPYIDMNRFCSKLGNKSAWNVMQYWKSSDGEVSLVDMNKNSINNFKYFNKESYAEKFDLFNFNLSDINYILPSHNDYFKSLKKDNLVYTSWKIVSATKDKCIQVLVDVRDATVSEIGQNINRGPIDEISPKTFFKELDYNLVVKNLSEAAFDATVLSLFAPFQNCMEEKKSKIQWTLINHFSFRQDGISFVDMKSNSAYYFSYLRDSSHQLFENNTNFVPYSLFQSLFDNHYEDELYVSWKDVSTDNKCFHVIHEIRKPRNEEASEYAEMKKNKV